jgi:hypothetical protein
LGIHLRGEKLWLVRDEDLVRYSEIGSLEAFSYLEVALRAHARNVDLLWKERDLRINPLGTIFHL